jgi:hypothetical protein
VTGYDRDVSGNVVAVLVPGCQERAEPAMSRRIWFSAAVAAAAWSHGWANSPIRWASRDSAAPTRHLDVRLEQEAETVFPRS